MAFYAASLAQWCLNLIHAPGFRPSRLKTLLPNRKTLRKHVLRACIIHASAEGCYRRYRNTNDNVTKASQSSALAYLLKHIVRSLNFFKRSACLAHLQHCGPAALHCDTHEQIYHHLSELVHSHFRARAEHLWSRPIRLCDYKALASGAELLRW